MKSTLFIALFLIAFGLGAQPAKEYFQKGIDMHKQQDYKAAIHDYNKAIKMNFCKSKGKKQVNKVNYFKK